MPDQQRTNRAGAPTPPGSVGSIAHDDILAVEEFPDSSDAVVYVSGSLLTPFGNPWSDIDVFALTDRAPRGPFACDGGVNRLSQHFVGGRRIDYEFWRPADIRALASRLATLELAVGSHPARGLFSYIEECFIDRLRAGLPLLNEPALRDYQSLFDFEKFARYQTQEVIRQIDAVHEDVCGMLEAGHHDLVLFSARRLVELTVDAYLHHRGLTDPNAKWRSAYLELRDDGSATHRAVVAEFWRLSFPEAVGPHAPKTARSRYAEDCLDFSRRITSWIQS